jgi:hypothetical protein
MTFNVAVSKSRMTQTIIEFLQVRAKRFLLGRRNETGEE